MIQAAVQTADRVNPFIVLGGLELFDWEKIVHVKVDNLFDPFKKKKRDRLMQSVDNIAVKHDGRKMLLDIYEANGVLNIVEGKPVPSGFEGPAMDYENPHTSYYDQATNTINVDFDELARMAYKDEETGERLFITLEYVFVYLMLYARQKAAPQRPAELVNINDHVKSWRN